MPTATFTIDGHALVCNHDPGLVAGDEVVLGTLPPGKWLVKAVRYGFGSLSHGDAAAVHVEIERVGDALALSPAQATLAASVVLAGLGWMIARRNDVPEGEREPAGDWARRVADWIVALVRGLVGREAS